MGCFCGKPDPDSYASPGRVLGSAPPQPRTAAVPKTYAGTTQRLGGDSSAGLASPSAVGQSDAAEARRRAAEAAERRANNAASKTPGKLGAQLAAQRKKTANGHLKDASEQALRGRELEANAAALRHD
ncbi:uncharacterized protein BROUX77_000197 [Berkeleyomyces rouxiae]|uniref:uncharacterized protein n=1 Tax=Berkeleyomyces rouxiae TaxID=2035830 RepID=UPI003B80F09B